MVNNYYPGQTGFDPVPEMLLKIKDTLQGNNPFSDLFQILSGPFQSPFFIAFCPVISRRRKNKKSFQRKSNNPPITPKLLV